MVYYRKYRPQTIDELDNQDVRETLTRVLASSDTPHAFLFTGPKGLGKTSSARIVAKVLNCEVRRSNLASEDAKKQIKNSKTQDPNFKTLASTVEPCNECDMCISITNGSNVDVLEIDAASNRGIDEIRDLREKIRLAPVAASKKVYIIDEVHMLTTEAFNALLKVLEEPPPHAVFILATTEPQKIPATIISRCLHINFHKATEDELLRSFRRIVKAEKLTVDDEGLYAIARLSDSGFRDGAKMLEELVLLAQGEPITRELIETRYKSAGSQHYLLEFLGLLSQKKLPETLSLINTITLEGVEMRFFIEEFLKILHQLLLEKTNVTPETMLSEDGKGLLLEDIRLLFEKLSRAHGEMRYAVLPQIPMEIAIIEWLTADQKVLPAQNGFAKEGKKEESLSPNKQEGVDVPDLRKKIGEMHKKQALESPAPVKKPQETEDEDKPAGNLLTFHNGGEHTKEWLFDFWRAFIIEVKSFNHTISGVLRGCHIRSFDKNILIIETSYKFHKDRLSEQKTREALEKAARVLTGNQVTVTVELSPGK